jgi:hypothetical protein
VEAVSWRLKDGCFSFAYRSENSLRCGVFKIIFDHPKMLNSLFSVTTHVKSNGTIFYTFLFSVFLLCTFQFSARNAKPDFRLTPRVYEFLKLLKLLNTLTHPLATTLPHKTLQLSATSVYYPTVTTLHAPQQSTSHCCLKNNDAGL